MIQVNPLYLVTDPELCGKGKLFFDTIERAVIGGVGCVQLREKNISTKDFIDKALKLKKVLQPYQVQLIINDRIDVALAVDADGVHIGQSDMPYQLARQILGKDKIIGLSVETWEQVEQAQKLDIDYLGISPVFATQTKTDYHKPWGLSGLQMIQDYSKHFLVAIGGVKIDNALSVLEAGADSLAIVSAICAADAPHKVSKKFQDIISQYFKSKLS